MSSYLVTNSKGSVVGMYEEGTPHSSGQDVTIAYPKRESRKKRTVLMEINSRDRNGKQYTNPSQFRWRLYRPLKDIVSIQIVGGSVPSQLYNMDCGWNSVTFVENGVRTNITIEAGHYDYQGLATAIAGQLNAIVEKKNSYSVQFSASSGKMIVTRNHGEASFGFLFETGDFVDQYDQNNTLQHVKSPARLWGFGRTDAFAVDGILRSPFAADIDYLVHRIYVYFNNDNTQDLGTIERSVGRQQPHAIIYIDECCGNYKFLNKETFEPIYLSFPAAIARLATLDISLRNEFDQLIDLNGRDFTLLLEMVVLD